MSHFEGFIVNAGRGQLVFLQVDPFQVGDAIEGFCWNAADVVALSEKFQSINIERKKTGSLSVIAVFLACMCFPIGHCVSCLFVSYLFASFVSKCNA